MARILKREAKRLSGNSEPYGELLVLIDDRSTIVRTNLVTPLSAAAACEAEVEFIRTTLYKRGDTVELA